MNFFSRKLTTLAFPHVGRTTVSSPRHTYTMLGSRACLRLISKGGGHRGTDSLPIFELPKAAFPFVCGKSCKIAPIKLVLLRGERIIHSAKKKITLFALLSIFGDGPVLSRSIFFHKFALITPERSEGFPPPPPPQLSSPDFYKLRSVYGLS